MEMGADFMPLYPMWSSWFSFYARRRTSSHSNPSCSHRRFAREPPPPSPIPVMPGIRRRPPGEGPPGAGSKEAGVYPQGARDPAPAADGRASTWASVPNRSPATQFVGAHLGRAQLSSATFCSPTCCTSRRVHVSSVSMLLPSKAASGCISRTLALRTLPGGTAEFS